VDPAKVPAGGVRARCAVCGNVFGVGAAEMAVPSPVARSAAAPNPGAVPAASVAAAAPVFTPAGPAPRTPPAPPPPPPMPPVAAPSVRRPTQPAPPATPPRPAPPVGAPVRPVAAPPVAAPAPRAAPIAPPRAVPPASPLRAPAAPVAPTPVAPSAVLPAAPAAGGTPLQRKTGPLRAVNPFLVQDPKQKARRLARALISDMIVYHPEKRQNGMRDGTLPQLFKDEIEKSWLEYVEQVGRDLAESTPFWNEALNEILAGGKKVF